MSGEPAEPPGLQAERTELAWERSAFGLLASAAILLFREAGNLGTARAVLGGYALAVALAVILLGRRRGRRTRVAHDGTIPDARTEVAVVGWAVTGLAIGAIALVIF